MTAKEMFEKLGYKRTEERNLITYKKNESEIIEINFDIKEKLYWSNVEVLGTEFNTFLPINYHLHQAISKQMEEIMEGI